MYADVLQGLNTPSTRQAGVVVVVVGTPFPYGFWETCLIYETPADGYAFYGILARTPPLKLTDVGTFVLRQHSAQYCEVCLT